MDIDKNSLIYVTGHNGMVGKSLINVLKKNNYSNLLTANRSEVDLTNTQEVKNFLDLNKPDIVINLAAVVGGIMANIESPAKFIYDNLMIQSNVIHYAYKNGCKKLIQLGSSCIYPKNSKQPLKEEYYMTGILEPTNQSYAVAKIAGIQMCQAYNTQYNTNFISPMPCNLYGPYDHFETNKSHFLAAMIRKTYNAIEKGDSSINVWGTGKPYREFMYINDLSEALLFLLENYDSSDIINVGTGQDNTIKELAEIVCETLDFTGDLLFDTSKPDGMFRKKLDTTKINDLGWRSKTSLAEGIKQTYEYYKENVA